MPSTFISKPELLIESPQVPDLLGLESEKSKILHLLDELADHATVGLIGKHGAGKSTLLNQVIVDTKEKYEWVIFDAWQFPDKSELWDAFCLKTAEHFHVLEKMREKLDGENPREVDHAETPNLYALRDWNDLFRGASVSRTYQFFNLLKALIDNSKKPVIFVIEDADRAGQPGLRFVETLHYFLSETSFEQTAASFVLIGSQAYSDDLSSYAKSLDYLHFFEPKHTSLEKFFNEILDLSLFKHPDVPARQLSSFFLYLMQKYQHFNLRLIKSILRRSNSLYAKLVQQGFAPDPRLIILAETAHFVATTEKPGAQKVHTAIRELRAINHQPFTALATAILSNERSILSRDGQLISYTPSDIKLVDAKVNQKSEIWQTNAFDKGTFSKKYYFDIPEES